MKDKQSPKEIAWELLSDVYENKAEQEKLAIFIPLAEYNSGMAALLKKIEGAHLICLQNFKPEVNALNHVGITCVQEIPPTEFDEVLFVPSKQRIESLGLLAQSLLKLKTQGRLYFCCHNLLGAGGFISHLKEVFPNITAESSMKCRYLIIHMEAPLDESQRDKLESWVQAASATFVPETEYKTLPGIYGWNKIDSGSELLLSTLPELSGKGADLGSGYGYLSHQALSRFLGIEHITLIEADQRSLNCARHNLKAYEGKCDFHWMDATSDDIQKLMAPFDWILMNPPFHQENIVSQDLGKEFIRTASKLLKKEGQLFMVANSFLAYENLLDELFASVNRITTQDGFKVIHAKR